MLLLLLRAADTRQLGHICTCPIRLPCAVLAEPAATHAADTAAPKTKLGQRWDRRHMVAADFDADAHQANAPSGCLTTRALHDKPSIPVDALVPVCKCPDQKEK